MASACLPACLPACLLACLSVEPVYPCFTCGMRGSACLVGGGGVGLRKYVYVCWGFAEQQYSKRNAMQSNDKGAKGHGPED